MEKFIDKNLIFRTAEELQNFAKKLTSILPTNSAIALIGPLGSGKTTFVQGLARGFGIIDNVNSPSFNIFHQYSGPINLLHIDAYRLDGSPQAKDGLMIDDFLIPPYCLIVEWPELLYNFLETCDFKIEFTINSDQSRTLCIKIS